MSRWISWVLQVGHVELNLEVSAGWVRLAPLAEAAARRFRQHKGMDEDSLRDFLNNTDGVGRFQISDDGYLRKCRGVIDTVEQVKAVIRGWLGRIPKWAP